MREINYLSPSSITLYLNNKETFYRQYLSDNKRVRDPQNQAMAIGSAFDAYVKSYLYEALFGKDHDPKYSLISLFEAQVEKQNRDWAWDNGKYVFEQYKQAGCLADLMLDMTHAQSDPRFEFEVMGTVQGYREGVTKTFGEVVLLGKPDAHYITKHGNICVLDWKVNGYCSNYPKSPMPGYICLRSAGKTHHGQHKNCQPWLINEMWVNKGNSLDELEPNWARQLAIYAWLMGSPVGSDFITIVHQVVCAPNKTGLPGIRVAEHVNNISPTFQTKTFNIAVNLWEAIKNKHIFDNLSYEDNLKLMDEIDNPKPLGEPLISIPLNQV